MAHGLELVNELHKDMFGDSQVTLDVLWMTIKKFLNSAFTWKNWSVIRLFHIQSTYNPHNFWDNCCEQDANNMDYILTNVWWDGHWNCYHCGRLPISIHLMRLITWTYDTRLCLNFEEHLLLETSQLLWRASSSSSSSIECSNMRGLELNSILSYDLSYILFVLIVCYHKRNQLLSN